MVTPTTAPFQSVETLEKGASNIKRVAVNVQSSINKGISSNLKRLKSRKVLQKSQASLTLSKQQVPSTWEDPNRFFKSEFDNTKRALFFR